MQMYTEYHNEFPCIHHLALTMIDYPMLPMNYSEINRKGDFNISFSEIDQGDKRNRLEK